MKFHCDKCRTRYSIGEDRVRGKILKIRCKNCGNVITVREGMDAAADGVVAAPVSGASALSTGATPAPAALEEEWYVSLDGNQTGPMSLTEAQRWVASKPLDADLYCWSEGFDDWLGTDKVSHFRNLRKPAPPARPAVPPPRAATAAPPPIPAKREEPKPLFAATMAAIEKEASGPATLPAPTPKPAIPSLPAVGGVQARVNGNGAARASTPAPATGKGSGPLAAIPESRARTPSGRFQAIKSSPATAAALSDAFDPESTQIGGPPEDVEPPPARPEPNKHGFDLDVTPPPVFTKASPSGPTATPAARPTPTPVSRPTPIPLSALSGGPAPTPAPTPAPVVDTPLPASKPILDEDDLAIGEVSRVVKLTDIVPRSRTPSGSSRATGSVPKISNVTGMVPKIGNATGAVPKIGGLTGSQPRFSPTDLGMNVDPKLVTPEGVSPDESVVAHSFAERHRRGYIALLGFAVVLVAGVIALVIFMTSKQSDDVGGGLGGTREIDTSRPEDIVRKQLPTSPTETGSNTQVTQRPRYVPRPNGTGPTQTPVDDDPKGLSLKASEVEDMAAKNGEGTKRCYMRAQKGAMGFEIADVKKIAVTLTVGKDGVVSAVDLSSHAADSFGQCLIARIKAWRFRESPTGGTFRISLAFSND